jgi:hypothetical protein
MVTNRAWKRNAAIVAATPEEGGSPGRWDGESAQEMRRANQGYTKVHSVPLGLPK